MRKAILSILGGAVFALVMPLTFTSCGNIDNPLEEISAATGIPEEELSAIMAAIEEGKEFTINFTYAGDPYYATFKKTGDTYEFISSESELPVEGPGTRGTRDVVEDYSATLTYEGGKLIFNFYQGEHLVLRVTFNAEDDTYVIDADPQYPAVFNDLLIAGAEAAGITTTTKTVNVTGGGSLTVYYQPGETWNEYIERSKVIFGDEFYFKIGGDEKVQDRYEYPIYYEDNVEATVDKDDTIGKRGDADVTTYCYLSY